MKKTLETKLISIATELFNHGRGMSGPELADFLSELMIQNKLNPQDTDLRKQIGMIRKDLKAA